tara:strand:- start:923 stop:1669 length:747 start_codon:yes stop_codon:yes gene_type:complete
MKTYTQLIEELHEGMKKAMRTSKALMKKSEMSNVIERPPKEIKFRSGEPSIPLGKETGHLGHFTKQVPDPKTAASRRDQKLKGDDRHDDTVAHQDLPLKKERLRQLYRQGRSQATDYNKKRQGSVGHSGNMALLKRQEIANLRVRTNPKTKKWDTSNVLQKGMPDYEKQHQPGGRLSGSKGAGGYAPHEYDVHSKGFTQGEKDIQRGKWKKAMGRVRRQKSEYGTTKRLNDTEKMLRKQRLKSDVKDY